MTDQGPGSASGRRGLPVRRALSEFVVIVVGVLVALALDGWNARRADRALELVYLDALARDLRRDSTLFAEAFFPALDDKERALAAIAPVVRGEAPVPGDTVEFLGLVSRGGRLGTGSRLILSPTYDELLSTGRLRLIESGAIRTGLVSHYTTLATEQSRIRARTVGYPSVVHEFFPGELRGPRTGETVRAFGVRRGVEAVLTPRFEAVMNQEINLAAFLRRSMETMMAGTISLLRAVEEERVRLAGS